MLRVLRNKKTAKKIWIGLAIIIIPAFTLWGFAGSFRSKEETAKLKKFGRNVSEIELKESLSAVKTLAIMQLGDDFAEFEQYLNLDKQAWERIILLREAQKRKIKISDKEVMERIQSYPFFQDKNSFNTKAYNETLRYIFRLQPRIFEDQTRQNLIIAKLYEQVTKNIKIDDEQVRQEYLKTNQELSIDYIASFFSDFTNKIKAGDKEIAAYFEKNKTMFQEPATKDQPVRIPELAEVKIKVKDTLIKEESRKMAEDKIKECNEKLKNKNFKQVAQALGLKTGQTEFFKSNGQIKELGSADIFWNTAKQLNDKNIKSNLSNDKGYYIIKLSSMKPIDETKFTKDKIELGEKLVSEKKNEAFTKFTEELTKKTQ